MPASKQEASISVLGTEGARSCSGQISILERPLPCVGQEGMDVAVILAMDEASS